MLINQVINQRLRVRETLSDSSEINRLLAAAAVSSRFCSLLLSDPARAIDEGFAGERFLLSADEQDFIVSLRAASLKEFATQLCEHLSRRYTPTQSTLPESFRKDTWPM
jgi:hypothetical protein